MTDHFPKTKITEQLNRILSAPAFRSSPVLSGFLEFVIGETVAGRETEIKEYTIGVSVLSRNSDFNPQLDAIVRIHAGRLRRALKEYYHDVGKNDTIYIDIPKGSYIPVFFPQNGTTHAPIENKTKVNRDKPVVAVLPFRNIGQTPTRDFFADGLGEQLSTELARFQDLCVMSYYSARHVASKTTDVRESAILLGAQYLLTGSVQTDKKHLRVRVQLILGDNGEQLWAKSFEENNTGSGLFEIQNEIVKSVLAAIGGYYGEIFRDVMRTSHNHAANGIETYDAIFWYYYYQKVSSKEVLQQSINALQAAVKADPNYALAWAMLGELYVDDKVHEFKEIENPIEEGLKCAIHAATLDVNCQHAYQSMAWIYLFLHNEEECLKAVDRCIAINPNAADKVGGMGFILTCAGKFERGYELLQDSVQRNPYCPWWFNGAFFFYFLQKKEYNKAVHWVEKIDTPELFWDPLLKAAALAHVNRFEEAAKNVKMLLKFIPDASIQVKSILESFLFSGELIKLLLEGLQKAGLVINHETSTLQLEK